MRFTSSAACAARVTAAAKSASRPAPRPPRSAPERAQVRRGVAAGAKPLALEDRRREADRRRLPFDPTTWIDANRRCGRPSTVMSRACGPARTACRTARATSRYSSAWRSPRLQLRQRLAVLRPASGAPSSTTSARRLRDELLVRPAYFSARSISWTRPDALCFSTPRPPPRRRRRRRTAAPAPLRPGSAPRRSHAVRIRAVDPLEPGEPAPRGRSKLVVAVRHQCPRTAALGFALTSSR